MLTLLTSYSLRLARARARVLRHLLQRRLPKARGLGPAGRALLLRPHDGCRRPLDAAGLASLFATSYSLHSLSHPLVMTPQVYCNGTTSRYLTVPGTRGRIDHALLANE